MDFKTFILDILKHRCRLKEKTIYRAFDNPASWTIMEQAFTHKSLGVESNYELLEFEGDVELNLAVVIWIRETYPDIVNVGWLTKIKHKLIGKHALATAASQNGFTQHIKFHPALHAIIAAYSDPMDNSDYEDMHEDTVEALCGAIVRILNTHTTRGVGHVAVCNLIKSFLDNADVSVTYEDIYDPKTRMKEVFDKYGWSDKFCNLRTCLVVYDLNESDEGRQRAMRDYQRGINDHGRREILETTDAFMTLGYYCDQNRRKVLLSVTTGPTKKKAEHKAANIVVARLKEMGFSVKPKDPYTNQVHSKYARFE